MQQEVAQILPPTADFIVKYGFLGVGLALVLIIAPAIHKVFGAKRLTLATVCFGLAFIVTYGALSVVSTVAPSLIVSQRAMLSGVILNVPEGHRIEMKSDLWRIGQAYMKRENDPENRSASNFRFLLVTSDLPACLAIAVMRPDPKLDPYLYNFNPLMQDDMSATAELVGKVLVPAATGSAADGAVPQEAPPPMLDVWREKKQARVGSPVRLEPIRVTNHDCGSQPRRARSKWFSFGEAYAQSGPALDRGEFRAALRSDDVFVRREARSRLARAGATAFNIIGAFLAQDDDYQLQLGAAVAVAQMAPDQRQALPAEIRVKLRALRGASDKTLRDTAVEALQEPAFCYQEENTSRQPAGRFLAICYWSKEQCEETRGPNLSAGVSQSACEPIQLGGLSWKYSPAGLKGGWFQYSPSSFGPPFPPVPRRSP